MQMRIAGTRDWQGAALGLAGSRAGLCCARPLVQTCAGQG